MKFLEHFQGFIGDNVKIATTFMSLVKLEARLAGLTIFPLIINICLLLVIALTAWLTFIVLLGIVLNLLINNVLISIFIVLVLNLIAIGILLKTLSSNLRKMSFEKTRESLRRKPSENHERKIEFDE